MNGQLTHCPSTEFWQLRSETGLVQKGLNFYIAHQFKCHYGLKLHVIKGVATLSHKLSAWCHHSLWVRSTPPSSPAPPSCQNMLTSSCKNPRLQQQKCHTHCLITATHKPVGDVIVATSIIFIHFMTKPAARVYPLTFDSAHQTHKPLLIIRHR